MADDLDEPSTPEGRAAPEPPAARRPPQVLQAIALLWTSTALGFAGSLSEVTQSQSTLILSGLVMLTAAITLSVGLWRGRNWARLLYLVLVAISLASVVSAWGTSEKPRFEAALEAVSFVADAGSFFLMFTSPGSTWFRPATHG